MTHAAELFKSVQQDQVNQMKREALKSPKRFVRLAARQGYKLNKAEVRSALEKLSPAQLAALLNPGVGTRQRLIPR